MSGHDASYRHQAYRAAGTGVEPMAAPAPSRRDRSTVEIAPRPCSRPQFLAEEPLEGGPPIAGTNFYSAVIYGEETQLSPSRTMQWCPSWTP